MIIADDTSSIAPGSRSWAGVHTQPGNDTRGFEGGIILSTAFFPAF